MELQNAVSCDDMMTCWRVLVLTTDLTRTRCDAELAAEVSRVYIYPISAMSSNYPNYLLPMVDNS